MYDLPLKFLLFFNAVGVKNTAHIADRYKIESDYLFEAGETVPQKTPLTSSYLIHWDHVMVINHVSFIACSSRWLIPFARP